jgi:hypothetical protein
LAYTRSRRLAYSLYWPNDYEQPLYYQLYLPLADRFPQRTELLDSIRQPLTDAGFSDQDSDAYNPLWKSVSGLEFNRPLRVVAEEILRAVLKGKGFQDLMKVETFIDKTVRQLPSPPPPYHRKLKPIAVLDTEWKGNAPRRKMTELAIKTVEYDPVEDKITGISGEYLLNIGGKLNKERARALLERAERIVAHNFNGDQSLLEQELPGIPKNKWIDSLHGIDWKSLAGTDKAGQQDLMLKLGLRDTQDHQAEADVNDLIRILAQKDKCGRTYLGRLLE